MGRVAGLTASRQCFLAEILSLEAENGFAWQSEIAERLGVNRPSVTAALLLLAERSLVLYEPYGVVMLTLKCRQMAESVLVTVHRAPVEDPEMKNRDQPASHQGNRGAENGACLTGELGLVNCAPVIE